MKRPKSTIQVGALAGGVTIVFVWALKELAGVMTPIEVAGGMQMVFTAIAQFLIPDEMEGP